MARDHLKRFVACAQRGLAIEAWERTFNLTDPSQGGCPDVGDAGPQPRGPAPES